MDFQNEDAEYIVEADTVMKIVVLKEVAHDHSVLVVGSAQYQCSRTDTFWEEKSLIQLKSKDVAKTGWNGHMHIQLIIVTLANALFGEVIIVVRVAMTIDEDHVV
ncbi:hypothetical protein GYMLUDRAFT_251562 [Collybiopsis luxurians FD-317 M1]|uniref:Uncharacterized protein n=1 Tax=Collybiopsis luxurians FD-317 M1 TaxID=944289 RepID=A0A0D0BQS2_9AGAR|nr:hypothetical protein GYMLUDRAFT_251562 [Collybiopsis luxurians FD-317 M1]